MKFVLSGKRYLEIQNIRRYGCARVTVLERRIIIVFVESNMKPSVC